MIIERTVSQYIVFSEDTVLNALRKIGENKKRFVFSVTEAGTLDGVLSDGDIRRWLIGEDHINLEQRVGEISNKDFVFAREGQSTNEIRSLLGGKIEYLPILDGAGHLTGIARLGEMSLQIGRHVIDDSSPVFVIAEIGNNHNGSLDLAIRLIDAAVDAGADCAKFQMRDMESLYGNKGNPDDASADLGSQYTLDLLSRFQLQPDEMHRAFEYCKQVGVEPLCTPWDTVSAQRLNAMGIDGFKIASADLTNHALLSVVAGFLKPIILSTGMSRESEILRTVALLRGYGAPFALLHCNSTYPTPFKDVNLRYMQRLISIGECLVGYSGHERGAHVPLAAVALGARIVEKHITVDREMEGNDHKVSLLPSEFSAMVRAIRDLEAAMGSEQPRTITQGELINRESLSKSLVLAVDIHQGVQFTREMIAVKSPGQGLQPDRIGDVVGRRAKRAYRAGEVLFDSDISDKRVDPRAYRFNRPWGVPVRFHDYRRLLEASHPEILEFHLSYKDLEIDLCQYFTGPLDVGLVVHSPELFAGDHILDLCSPNDAFRERSIAELERVIAVTRGLAAFFPRTPTPCIVTNVGGYSVDGPLSDSAVHDRYRRFQECLSRIDRQGVEIIPQTMPPFPWHFGGQRYHNTFVHADDIAAQCAELNLGICLDVSHSKLACNQFDQSFRDFLATVGPYVRHLHIADAQGIDGEGLQIGCGDIDFHALAADLSAHCPKASFIPEVWQGHKDNGEGFWVALHELEMLGF